MNYNRPSVGFVVALTAAAVMAVIAGWFGYSWWEAEHDEGVQRGVAREAALDAGRRAIGTFTTLDYRDADSGYRRWLDVSTGPLHDELAHDEGASKPKISQARTVTEGRVLDAAVTDLDTATGRAKVIASLEIGVTPPAGQRVTKHDRFQAELNRTDAGWKVSAVGPVPVSGQ